MTSYQELSQSEAQQLAHEHIIQSDAEALEIKNKLK